MAPLKQRGWEADLRAFLLFAADETWHEDLWLLFAAASPDTTNIRFGPSLSGVVLREPTRIAQAAATLDELTQGSHGGGARVGELRARGLR
jgi:alkanesulfonate monooxygenase SsuD/methylene tetrahydromethanopterin reductase-like flavin-dependent oxidoreductase (luciferase family)